ncbi:uncharacterized protein LOC135398836 [Ornithodoros turicata]|uniref:uncharacterized protein LOC135398836 n=1 Tax=Ornithodoros turicata TaxID=34597 RepID=UPI003138A646
MTDTDLRVSNKSGFLSDYYDYLLSTFPCVEFLSSSDSPLLQRLIGLQVVFQNEHCDIAAPCTGSKEESCWIFSDLTPWNRVLFAIRIQLVASTPSQLTLCSMAGRYSESFDESIVLEACVLVHWLLKWHHCISEVHLNSYYYATSQFACLFHDSLYLSTAVRRLVISCVSDRVYGGDLLAAALGAMDTLEQLELREVSLDSKALNEIGHKIGARNTITRLTFFGNAERPQSSAALLDGLKFCTALKFLKLCVMYIGSDSARCIEAIFERNKALEKVAFWNVSFTCNAFQVVAASLRTLVQLKRLEFVSCVLQPTGIPLLAEAIEHGRQIRSLRLEACRLGDSDAHNALILPPLASAAMNSSLQELCFSNISVSDEGARVLARYLSSSCSLQKLFLKANALTVRGVIELLEGINCSTSDATYHLGHVATNDNEADLIRRALQKTGAGNRVQLTYSAVGYLHLSRALKTNSTKVTKLLLEDNLYLTSRHLEELFEAVGHNVHITQLIVKSGQLNLGVANTLSHALSVNKALKSLELGVEVHPLCQIILFKSLAKNTSLSKLVIKRCRFDESSVEAFVEMLKRNETLNHFSKFSGTFRLVEKLSFQVSQNYTLLKLNFDLECIKTKATFAVEDTLRRNQTVLNLAVKFALRLSRGRTSALSFEKLLVSSAFVEHLAKVGGFSKCQAENCIRSALHYVTVNYLVLTRVVNGRLECFDNGGDALQIDQLNQECLYQIFSYLKVSDVVGADDTVVENTA